MTIAAVIPTRFYPDTLCHLVRVLAADGVVPIVVPDVFDRGPDWSLYRLWNTGVRLAADIHGADHVAILNDDVTILSGTMAALRTALDEMPETGVVCPDTRQGLGAGINVAGYTPVHGTWGSQGANGMTGFAFMLRASLGIPFDEGYHWWYGDDQFAHDVWTAGHAIMRVDGLPIWHLPGQSHVRARESLQPLIEADRMRWDRQMVMAE